MHAWDNIGRLCEVYEKALHVKDEVYGSRMLAKSSIKNFYPVKNSTIRCLFDLFKR